MGFLKKRCIDDSKILRPPPPPPPRFSKSVIELSKIKSHYNVEAKSYYTVIGRVKIKDKSFDIYNLCRRSTENIEIKVLHTSENHLYFKKWMIECGNSKTGVVGIKKDFIRDLEVYIDFNKDTIINSFPTRLEAENFDINEDSFICISFCFDNIIEDKNNRGLNKRIYPEKMLKKYFNYKEPAPKLFPEQNDIQNNTIKCKYCGSYNSHKDLKCTSCSGEVR